VGRPYGHATLDTDTIVFGLIVPHRREEADARSKRLAHPAKPGVPPNPDQEGPHLIKDERGVRRWYFWVPSRTSWFSAFYERHQLYAGEHWTYIGAAIEPDEPDSFQRQASQPRAR
jgi:hypothetical protein